MERKKEGRKEGGREGGDRERIVKLKEFLKNSVIRNRKERKKFLLGRKQGDSDGIVEQKF